MFLIPQGYETAAGCRDSALEQEYGYMLNLAMESGCCRHLSVVVAYLGRLCGIENLPALQPDLNQMGNALALFNDLADGWIPLRRTANLPNLRKLVRMVASFACALFLSARACLLCIQAPGRNGSLV